MRVSVTRRLAQSPEIVFAYISEPGNMPAWNSAVVSVEPPTLDPTRYRMRRDPRSSSPAR